MKNQVFATLPSEFDDFSSLGSTPSRWKGAAIGLIAFVSIAVGLFAVNNANQKPSSDLRSPAAEAPAPSRSIAIPDVPLENKPVRKPVQKNASTGKQNLYTGPRIISEHKVAKILQRSGFPARTIPKLVCTAHYESNYDVAAKNENSDGTLDTGLFQINDSWLKICGVTRRQLRDPKVNSSCALKVYKAQGMNAWVAFRKKKEKCSDYKIGDFAQAKAIAQAQAQAQPQLAME